MNKERLKGFVAGILVTVMLSAGVVFAASSGVMREIHHGISVVLHGTQAEFDEDSTPFVMDGRTYLPLRAMADLLNLPVDFNPETNTAYVGFADAGQLLLGSWIEEESWSWRLHIEFFDDNTGRAFEMHSETGEKEDMDYFIWTANDNNSVILTIDFGDGDEEITFSFRIFREIAGTEEFMLATLTWDDGWEEQVIFSRVDNN